MTKQEQDMLSEIHQYLLSKDGMRLGQRIKTNFSSVDNKIDAYQLNMLNRLSDIQDKLDEPEITFGQFFMYLGLILVVFGGLLIWVFIA